MNNMRHHTIRTFTIAALGTLLSGAVSGQPAFEVASVRVNKSGESEPTGDAKNGRFTLHNCPMFVIVARAYQVSFDRVVGPEWLKTERYDIDAKYAPDTTGENLWLMVQRLLAERFKLVVHHEQKPVTVWALVVGKKGPKLRESPADSTEKPTWDRQGAQLTFKNRKTTMAELADQLPHWMSRDWFGMPVVDQTGLQGAYDFDITYTPTRRPEDTVDPPAASLFDAIQDQLGLKLEQRKVPVDRIVIDSMEKVPTEN
jgi:uncharacterized protein (TIGR03435 family)